MTQEAAGRGEPSTPRLVVVGDLTLDDVVLPDGTTRMGSVGGDSLYSALGARLWEPSIGVVTRRGDDFPRAGLGGLERLGIQLGGVVEVPGPTIRNWVIYEADGRRHWVYRTPPGRPAEIAVHPGDIPPSWLGAQPPPVVHIAAMPIDAAESIVDAVRAAVPSAVITLDTHEDYVADYRAQLRSLAGRVDVFLPSREELADLVGYDDPSRALAALAVETAAPTVVIKMGPDGAIVWSRSDSSVTHVSAVPASVVDVTGAGDAFCGGFAAGLASGLEPVEAARRGVISAAFAVEGFSSLRLMEITPEVAAARLRQYPPRLETSLLTAKPATTPEGDASIELMYREIYAAPTVVATQLDRNHQQTMELARSLADAEIKNLFLVGCGDSYLSGAAAELAFARHAGVPAQAVHALDMARYRVRHLPESSAVLCISYSGEVGRTIEAAVQARAFGHRVIAMTGNLNSRLAMEATDVLSIAVPTPGSTPGTISFIAMLIALYELGIEWGSANGLEVDGARAGLKRVPGLITKTLELCDPLVRRLATRLRERTAITFIGAGPNEATAKFGAAKLFEGPQMRGVAVNLEEWAHGEYFISSGGQAVIMVAPSGAASDRAAEILSELKFIDADTVLISDAPPPGPVRTFIEIARGLPEELSPLLANLPLCLLAFYLARARGKQSYNFSSPELAKEHYDTIHRATRGHPA